MKYRNEVKIGVALILAVIAFYIGTQLLRDLPVFSRVESFSTMVPDAAGVAPGNAVRINGVSIGSVHEVQLIQDGARIRFTVNPDIRLTHGSLTFISSVGFFGDTQLGIKLGPPDATLHESGDVIPSETGDALVGLSESAPKTLRHADSLITSTADAVDAARRLLSDPESNLLQTFASVQESADALSAILAEEQLRLTAVLEDMHTLTGALTVLAQDSLAIAAGNINLVLARLQDNLAALERTTVALTTLLDGINSGQGTLGKLVTEDSLYTEIRLTVSDLHRLLTDFEENPKKYLKELKLVDIF